MIRTEQAFASSNRAPLRLSGIDQSSAFPRYSFGAR